MLPGELTTDPPNTGDAGFMLTVRSLGVGAGLGVGVGPPADTAVTVTLSILIFGRDPVVPPVPL